MYRVGIDIGSTATKVAVLHADDTIEKTYLFDTGYNSRDMADKILKVLEGDGITKDNAYFVATGYGRGSVLYADKRVTEITCHGKGAEYLFHQDGTVIDIGGQDTKGIMIKSGKVLRFIMNDKCSAGTGKFLEIMANRLALSSAELSEMARKGEQIEISSMCTVFAESEVISLIGNGVSRENIASGVVGSVVRKVTQLLTTVENTKYFLTGGLCEDSYLREKLEAALGAPVETVPMARFAGAIGAALAAEVG